jgi:ribosome-associated protein
MSYRAIDSALVGSELEFITSRSSGPGGQNVNKVNSKVTLRFDITHSKILTDDEKFIIATKLHNKLTEDGVLLISAQDKRSQLNNKEEAIRKFDFLLKKAFEKQKPRKKTKPSKGAMESRIKKKKAVSEKKKWRRAPIG